MTPLDPYDKRSRTWLLALADQLESAPRVGAETDTPEGGRFVQLSDTLVRLLVEHLRINAAEKRLADSEVTLLCHRVEAAVAEKRKPTPPPNRQVRDGDSPPT